MINFVIIYLGDSGVQGLTGLPGRNGADGSKGKTGSKSNDELKAISVIFVAVLVW